MVCDQYKKLNSADLCSSAFLEQDVSLKKHSIEGQSGGNIMNGEDIWFIPLVCFLLTFKEVLKSICFFFKKKKKFFSFLVLEIQVLTLHKIQ